MAQHPSPDFVDLSALLSSVSDQALLADPGLQQLMAEYVCYELYLADWYARRPPRSHAEFNDWIIEGRAVIDGLDALKKAAYGYLLRD